MHTHTSSDRTFIATARARDLLPGRPARSTVWYWMTKGLDAGDGARLRLQAWRVNGRLHTNRRAVERFLAELQAAGVGLCARGRAQEGFSHAKR